ncbi:hypothetical protein [Intestinibacter bartlettii]|uniref:hypothetical protein n=1 Tax=Intestinibacter bartlettii TaxID=261299 RepID=UPI0034B01482
MQNQNLIFNVLTVSDFISIILTFVYVVATIFICVFNYKSAKAAKDQIIESQKQFKENNIAKIIISFEVISYNVYAFVIRNIGNQYATDINVKVNEDLINRCEGDLKGALNRLNNSTFVLAPKKDFSLVIFPVLCETLFQEKCKFNISYFDSERKINETTIIDLSQYSWASNYKTKEYTYYIESVKNQKELIKELKEVNKNIAKLNIQNKFNGKSELSKETKIFLINFKKIKDNLNLNEGIRISLNEVNENINNPHSIIKQIIQELKYFDLITDESNIYINYDMDIYFTNGGILYLNNLNDKNNMN